MTPQNLIFGACGAKKCEKCVSIDMGKRSKITFLHYGIRFPSKNSSPYRDGSPSKSEFRALSVSIKSQVSSLNSQLSTSQLSSLHLLSERARQKFLGVGGCPGQNRKVKSSGFPRFYTPQCPPSTFLILCLKAKKTAQVARYCMRSFQRVQG